MSTSSELKARKAAAVPNGVGTKGIYVAKAENSEIWDVDGKRYIDFAAGIAVLNTGHRHPKIMAAVAEQARQAVREPIETGYWRVPRPLAGR